MCMCICFIVPRLVIVSNDRVRAISFASEQNERIPRFGATRIYYMMRVYHGCNQTPAMNRESGQFGRNGEHVPTFITRMCIVLKNRK